MTDREKAIVMAYTGTCMLTGDKLSVFYEYVKSIMGRPVYTHEMAIKAIDDEIKEKARPDFIALCADESGSENPNKSEIPTGWMPVSEGEYPEAYTDVLVYDKSDYFVAWWTGIRGRWDSYDSRFEINTPIVAWMPIEPYEGFQQRQKRSE